MESRSILLEHTLVLAGESVDCDTVWQGWPSEAQISLKEYESHIQRNIEDLLSTDVKKFDLFIRKDSTISDAGSETDEKRSLLESNSVRSGCNSMIYSAPSSPRRKDGYSAIRQNDECSTCVRSFFCQENDV